MERVELAPPPKQAGVEEPYGAEAGNSLLQVGGQFSQQSQSTGDGPETTSTDTVLQASLGYFLNNWLELGGQVVGNWTFTETEGSSGGSDSGSLFLAPYLNVNVPLGRRLWLYAGPHAGLGIFYFTTEVDNGIGGTISQSDSVTDFEYGAHGGARLWVTPRTSLFGELRYTAASVEFSDDVTTDIDTVQILWGFNVVF